MSDDKQCQRCFGSGEVGWSYVSPDGYRMEGKMPCPDCANKIDAEAEALFPPAKGTEMIRATDIPLDAIKAGRDALQTLWFDEERARAMHESDGRGRLAERFRLRQEEIEKSITQLTALIERLEASEKIKSLTRVSEYERAAVASAAKDALRSLYARDYKSVADMLEILADENIAILEHDSE